MRLEDERRQSDGFRRLGVPEEVDSRVEVRVGTEAEQRGQLPRTHLANRHKPRFLQMSPAMIGELTTLSEALLTHIASKGSGASVNELVLFIVLLGAENLLTEVTLKLMEVRVAVRSVSAEVVFGSVDTRTVGEGTFEAAVVGAY